GRVQEPEPAGLEVLDELRDVEAHGRVVVSRIWHVRTEDVDDFLATMRLARDVRRRTGARAWELHRDALDPEVFTEVVHYADWEEHLLQRTRLDTDDLAVLRRLRELDVDGAPRSRLHTPVDP